MDPMMASAFMGGAGGGKGGDQTTATSSATSTALAGIGSMSFGAGKAWPIVGAVVLTVAVFVVLNKLSRK